jgi:hypothetical protein
VASGKVTRLVKGGNLGNAHALKDCSAVTTMRSISPPQ